MIVFIVGPYRADSAWKIEQNVRRAESVALEVWKAGHVAVCAHAMTRYYQDELPDEVWLSGIRKLMARCDAVIAIPGWLQSEGSVLEVAVAREHGLMIYYVAGQLPEPQDDM